jgi:diguanylate cyclase (GGDEF)-like protein/PAS domain S-box-containing protein
VPSGSAAASAGQSAVAQVTDAAPAAGGGRLKLTTALPMLGALAVLLLFAQVANTLYGAYKHELARATTDTINLSEVLKEQTARTLQTVDTELRMAIVALGPQAELLRGDPRKVRDGLRETLRQLPFVRAIWVVDAQGRMAYDSDSPQPAAQDFSDREYFRWHLAGADGLFVGKPVKSRTTGDWFIAVSRSIHDRNGRLTGVIVAAIDPDYFERFYDTLKLGREGAVSVRHVDGELIARAPRREDLIGAPPPYTVRRIEVTRTLRVVSAVDGIDRIYTSRPVEAAPLVVTVGISVREAMSHWRRVALAYVAATLAFSLLIAWLTWRLTAEVRRRESLAAALGKEEAMLRQVVESLPVGVFVANADGHIFLTNSVARRIWAADERLHTDDFREYKGRWSRSGVELGPRDWAMARALSRGETSNSEMVDIECFDGSRKTILNWGAPIIGRDGRIVGAVAVNEDITTQSALAAQLGDSEARFEAMFEYGIEAMLITATDGRVLAANREACRLLACSREQLMAHAQPEILARDDARTQALLDQRERTGHVRGEATIVRRDGTRFPGEIASALYRDSRGEIEAGLTIRDITARKEAEEKIAHLAYHDELTGVYNRAFFTRALERALAQGERHKREFALLMLDLDGFKAINDRYGHVAGDQLLVQVARRLRACVREADTVARLGGDEFVLMLEQPGNEDAVRAVGRKVLAATAAGTEIDGQRLSVTASLGIALYPRDGSDFNALLRAADAAMYRAKEKGRNRMQVHGEDRDGPAAGGPVGL